jgi:phenylpyruvate tautomerase PptA (4-oxalocrotonate tautomerase family)
LSSLADDVARLQHVLELQDGMTIVVGHSPNASSPAAWARLPSKLRPVTSQWSPTRTRSPSSSAPLQKEFIVPMVDVYAAARTFGDRHELAVDLATAVMAIEQVPDINVDSTYVRAQVLSNAGALDRGKQLSVVEQLSQIVATAAGDPSLADRTWVLLTEAVPGGWGLGGHANTNEELVLAARARIADLQSQQ